jgi:hypothetical protein
MALPKLVLVVILSVINLKICISQTYPRPNVLNYQLELKRFDIDSPPIYFYLFFKEPLLDSNNFNEKQSIYDCIGVYDANKISPATPPTVIDAFQKEYKITFEEGLIIDGKGSKPLTYSTFFIQVDTSRFIWDENAYKKQIEERLELIELKILTKGSFKFYRNESASSNVELCWKLKRALTFFSKLELKPRQPPQRYNVKQGLELSGHFGTLFGSFGVNSMTLNTFPVFTTQANVSYRIPVGDTRSSFNLGFSLIHTQNKVKLIQKDVSFLIEPSPTIPVDNIRVFSTIPVEETIHWATFGIKLPIQLNIDLGVPDSGISWFVNGSVGYNFSMPAEAQITQGLFSYQGIVASISDPLTDIPEWNLEDNVAANRFELNHFFLSGFCIDFISGIRYSKGSFFSEIGLGFTSTTFYFNEYNGNVPFSTKPGQYSTSINNLQKFSGSFLNASISIGHKFN